MSLERCTDSAHIIVAGFGHLGRRIVEHLRDDGCAVTIIEKDDIATARLHAERLGCRLIEGDASEESVLIDAGMTSARAFIAVTGDDQANIEAALIAHQYAPHTRVIVRLFDEALARQAETAFNVDALSASFLAAPAFFSAATDESIVAAFNIDGYHLRIYNGDATASTQDESILLTKHGCDLLPTPAEDKADLRVVLQLAGSHAHSHRKHRHSRRTLPSLLSSLQPRRVVQNGVDAWHRSTAITRGLLLVLLASVVVNVIVFGTWGGLSPLDALYFVITTMTTTGYGDINLQHAAPGLKLYGVLMMLCGAGLLATIYAIISEYVLTARLEYLLGRRDVNLIGHTIVVGLGKIGYRVARDLYHAGIEVAAVEVAEDSDNVRAARLSFPVIIGNAARSSVLEKAGVERASVITAVTDNPMLNLSVALHARERNPHIKAVVRTYDPKLTERLCLSTLDAVLSTSAIAAPAFVDAALAPGVEGSFDLDSQRILVVRHVIDAQSPFLNQRVSDVGKQSGIAIVMIAERVTSSQYQVTHAQDVLQDGQKVIALMTREKLALLAG